MNLLYTKHLVACHTKTRFVMHLRALQDGLLGEASRFLMDIAILEIRNGQRTIDFFNYLTK